MNIDCVKSYVAAEGRRKVQHSAQVEAPGAEGSCDAARGLSAPLEGE